MVIVFVLYFIATFALGLWQARKTKSQSDFVLGGKKLPGWMLALSERATGESAWLLLGLTGFIYTTGLSGIWTGVGCLIGIASAWIILARKFRAEAETYKAMTMPEYFAAKFSAKANLIRILSTGIIVFFFVFYVGAQFAGAGKTIQQTFGFSPVWGMIISAAVILGYATFGGFVSVVAVDALQSVLMLITLVVTPIIILIKVFSSPVSLSQAFAAAGPGYGSLTGGLAGFAAGLMIFNNLAWVFGYLGGLPQLNARFMGMKDDRNVRTGRDIAVAWTIIAYSGVVVIGLGAQVLYGPKAVADTEMILPYLLNNLFPGWLAALLLAGAVAAMISTAESMLLVAATSISEDVYKGILKKGQARDKTLLFISRAATVSVGILGLVLALTTKNLIYSIVSYAWAGIGCSFAPAVLLSFYWDRFSAPGVVTALAAGLVSTVVWMLAGWDATITARASTFVIAMTLAVLVTLLTGKKSVPKTARSLD
ncbi:MAG: sodium/proline symporter [Candidatus Aminicenantes bacterium]|nr:sodium/proline symporter [Candidatus Aminicenantes bacterium]